MQIEEFSFESSIDVVGVLARSFPEGVPEAHETLHRLIPMDGKRRYFGISAPQNGQIQYVAAAEITQPLEGDIIPNSENRILPQGPYACIQLENYLQNLNQIESCFEQLLQLSNIDPNGFCLEYYVNQNTLLCLVPLNPNLI